MQHRTATIPHAPALTPPRPPLLPLQADPVSNNLLGNLATIMKH